ncbi:protein translocase subunit SecD [Nocardioides acrostichi]|uniref:Protein translocase subunit SecD n=1 Tax=Nocardioides acrostichi TaxID=2784339 RepID=A0A930Y7M9_9ACTN|nr:protein translocase subunit SecD [Nocardioides acrostichi]MBF4162202.1 protein translocase subunit SecD [Nocardioides acrostichi]
MARNKARPGRTLVVFALALAVAYGLVALAGTWKPSLGLDLRGGTSITLRATGSPSQESLDEARQIIDDRVNGSGTAEADVTTQGSNEIVIEVPGKNARDLLDTITRTAQLRFRLVACSAVDGQCGGTTGSSGATSQLQQSLPSGAASGSSDPESGGSDGTGNNRPPVGFAVKPDARATASPSASPTSDSSPGADVSATPLTTTSSSPTGKPTTGSTGQSGGQSGGQQNAALKRQLRGCTSAAAKDKTSTDPLTWIDSPTQACVDAFNAFSQANACPKDGSQALMADEPDSPLITCDDSGVPFLLSNAMIEGTQLKDAAAEIPQNQVGWVVTLSFNGEATSTFGKVSSALAGTEKQFAIVLDGQVLSNPVVNEPILDGNAQISGNFNETSANSLATSLRYGSLPISFEKDPLAETIGPSLAGDYLTAGLTAGAVGLAIVMLYCLLYYRGLGMVVIASLVASAAITYALVLLLSETAGFTLTLPGIAGLIIAIGITADSFIVYFERIRDEMRAGKSMRVAVEAGWKRARNTCLAADAVSLLAAVVLYVFAAGVVKGFAFALGLTTLIDLGVFFWFTHPMVSWLARFRFFNRGHRLSGLNAETLGIDRITPGTPAGRTKERTA